MTGPLALTLGEPAGIGPDITLKSWTRRTELELPAFYVLGDADYLRERSARLGLSVPVATVAPEEVMAAFVTALPVVDVGERATAKPGLPDQTSAPIAIAAIRTAVEHVLAGAAGAIVTNPVAKNVLYRSGFAEPGHTEFLGKLATQATGRDTRPVMMLWAPQLASCR